MFNKIKVLKVKKDLSHRILVTYGGLYVALIDKDDLIMISNFRISYTSTDTRKEVIDFKEDGLILEKTGNGKIITIKLIVKE